MNNLDIFNNSAVIIERKIPPKIISWITIMILSLIIILCISLFYKYNKYLYYLGTVIINDKSYYISLYVEKDKIPYFQDNELIINNKKTKYKIINISEKYYLTELKKEEHEVQIECLLDDKMVISNNLVELRFKMPKTTIMQEIIKKIKKELE